VNHFEDFHPIEEQVPREGYQNGDSDHEMPVDESENEEDSLNDVEDIAEYDDNVAISIDDDSSQSSESEDEDEFLLDLKNSAFNILLSFRSKNAIPYTTTIEIINQVKAFVTSAIQKSVAIVNQEFGNGENNDYNNGRKQNIIAKLNLIPTVFSDLETEWKVQKMYKRHPRFVMPKTVKMGFNVSAQKFNTAQYVSIRETIQSLVLDQEFVDLLFQREPDPS
jgi:hypothetical protein